MTGLRVASVQFELRSEESLDAYLTHTEALVSEAVGNGAELVVFPEFASTGLLGTISDHEVTAETISDDYRHHLASFADAIAAATQDIAQRHNVTLLSGSHNRIAEDGSLRNTAFLAHPDGRLEMQDKLHLTPQEHEMGATGGNELLVTQIGPFKAGLLICADIQFPELSRYLSKNGVELIVCPSLTWNRRGVHRVKTGCEARAIENQMFVVMSPLIGSSGFPSDAPMYAVGKSLVTTPVDRAFGLNDGLLAASESNEEGIIYADLDLDVLSASRENPEAPGLKLQRPDLYRELDGELAAS
ncbi:MAG: nitrilase-related carbon-nitrogen hydrolase [Gulosibacter sp.]|uniref:nitrilase-related carbon-nitrogen hydrolase n=1 Tax=Gulosibacter sp. TaxID=2817531 RepID=UPI003F8F24C8